MDTSVGMRGRSVTHAVLGRLRRRSRLSKFRQCSVSFKKALQRVWLMRWMRKRQIIHTKRRAGWPVCPNCGESQPMELIRTDGACRSCGQALRVSSWAETAQVIPVVPLCVWLEARPEGTTAFAAVGGTHCGIFDYKTVSEPRYIHHSASRLVSVTPAYGGSQVATLVLEEPKEPLSSPFPGLPAKDAALLCHNSPLHLQPPKRAI